MAKILLFIIPFTFCISVYSMQETEKVFYGMEGAPALLKNIDFSDVKAPGTWAREAIYEVGALEIVKGYGNGIFGRTNGVTKEEAIAIIYRAAGRETDAQMMAEIIDNMRSREEKNTNALAMWSDGYLQLAANEGLISAKDLEDAFSSNQDITNRDFFNRRAPAQRQELAYWISSVLDLEPIYGQQKIFNNFRDWMDADPHKIPYIETVLVENIMNGEGNGYFRPTGHVTREQLAQIIKNADFKILPLLDCEKYIGTIEEIKRAVDLTQQQSRYLKTFNIRNSNGKLHEIITELYNNSEQYKNELEDQKLSSQGADLIVYKDGLLKDSSCLEKGDRIEYIASKDKRIKYIKVLSNTSDTKYIVAQINDIDFENNIIRAAGFFDIEYPVTDMGDIDPFIGQDGDGEISCVYSSSADVFIGGVKSDITDILPNMEVILSIRDNIIFSVETLELRLKDQGVIGGIVEDNNPHLGYITLYNSEFTSQESPGKRTKTYNYANPKSITVYKNNTSSTLEEIENGDSAYIKLSEKGEIEIISAVDNYIVKHGKVISKNSDLINVAYDEGVQQVIRVQGDVPVELEGKLVDYNTLRDGDRIKLLLNVTDKNTALKKITIEGDERFITNIYRGIISDFDYVFGKLLLKNMEKLGSGKWERIEQKGFTTLGLAEDSRFISGIEELEPQVVKGLLKNRPAYIAVEKDYSGKERAVFVSFKNTDDNWTPVFDDIISASTGGKEGAITLGNEYRNIHYDGGTIIVKDNRLVTGGSINAEDHAFVAASRSYKDGEYYAGVIQISEKISTKRLRIYRGRINAIKPNESFTVESFSELGMPDWSYFNTPKSFEITYDTRILDDDGVVGQRDFTDRGDEGFKGRTVYIIAEGTEAVLISTTPYGNINIKGEICDIIQETAGGGGAGAATDRDEGETKKPAGIRLLDIKRYDPETFIWVDSEESEFSILQNSIIIKRDNIIKPTDLKKGDKVRIITNDSSETGYAYIIFVE